MDAQTSTPAAKPKSNKTRLIIGGLLLVCCCLAVLAAILVWPTINGLLGSGASLYSGRADAVLKQDVLNVIANYEAVQNGCSDVSLFMGQVTLSPEQTGDGTWTELWQV